MVGIFVCHRDWIYTKLKVSDPSNLKPKPEGNKSHALSVVFYKK